MSPDSLSSRLYQIACYIQKGSLVADIGTDHALLPIFLVKNKQCRAIAADIESGPLSAARQNIEAAECDGSITIVQTDGLAGLADIANFSGLGIDVVVIAGMGAETIIEILTASPDFPAVNYIFQPMTREEKLRKYLLDSGFTVTDEAAVIDKGKVYVVMNVVKHSDTSKKTEDYIYFGPHRESDSPASISYVEKVNRKLKWRTI